MALDPNKEYSIEELLNAGGQPVNNEKTSSISDQSQNEISEKELLSHVPGGDDVFDFLTGKTQTPPSTFLTRLALSFGGPNAKALQQRIETAIGQKGKVDIGDIADVAGPALPILGSFIGGTAGIGGAAIGTGVGKFAQEAIGQSFGVRNDISAAKELRAPFVEAGLTYAGGKAGQYLINRLPKFLGIVSGESPDIIEEVLKNPQAADEGIRNGDEALRTIVQKAGDATIKLKDSMIKAHSQAFQQLASQSTKKLVNPSEIEKRFNQILTSKGVKISKKGTLNFATSKIKANPGEIAKINAVSEALDQWDDYSLAGINELKQLVGQLTRFADEAGVPSKSPTLGSFYSDLNELIALKLPPKLSGQYLRMNEKFTNTIDLYNDLVDAFNKGDPFTKMTQSLGANKDTLRQLLQFLDKKTGIKVLPTVAGRKLAEERQAAFGLLNPREWIDLIYSPRAQARTVSLVGKLGSGAQKVLEKYQGLNPFTK